MNSFKKLFRKDGVRNIPLTIFIVLMLIQAGFVVFSVAAPGSGPGLQMFSDIDTSNSRVVRITIDGEKLDLDKISEEDLAKMKVYPHQRTLRNVDLPEGEIVIEVFEMFYDKDTSSVSYELMEKVEYVNS